MNELSEKWEGLYRDGLFLLRPERLLESADVSDGIGERDEARAFLEIGVEAAAGEENEVVLFNEMFGDVSNETVVVVVESKMDRF